MATVYTFTEDELQDITYDLEDSEIINDVLAVSSDTESDLLIRGYNTDSIQKYGRRSKRLTRPIGTDDDTVEALIEDQLNRDIEPVPMLTITIDGLTIALIVQILTLKISDKITVQCARMGMNMDVIIESVEAFMNKAGVIAAKYTAKQLRTGE